MEGQRPAEDIDAAIDGGTSGGPEVCFLCLTNQTCSNIFQPPGDDVDGNLGASRTSGQNHSPSMRQCLELLSNISAAVDRNTKMTDLMANYIMHGRPGATGEATSSSAVQGTTGGATSSSTVQQSEDKSDEDVSEVNTRRFRACSKLRKHKDADELRIRVSCLSFNK